jgi:hypothetical protein
MRLGWSRDQDGVVVVYAHAPDGRVAPVADFWLQGWVDKMGFDRSEAKAMQEQFADRLVNSSNNQTGELTKAELAEYVARRMLAHMANSGSLEAFFENMAGYPELYLSELAAEAIDCIDLSGFLKNTNTTLGERQWNGKSSAN